MILRMPSPRLNQSPSAPIPRTNNFDLIRLLAATQVVVGHAYVLLTSRDNAVLEYGMRWLPYFPGVPIFFTVSGFLVYWSFERNADHIGQFFKNRVLRIYPALWVSFLVTIAMLLSFQTIGLSTFGRLDFQGWILRQVTFLQFGTPDVLRSWGDGQVNRSLWTISVELQFYVVLPFIACFLGLFGKRAFLGWLGVLFGSILCYALLCQLPASNILHRLTPLCVVTYLFNFLIGMAFYKWWPRLRWLVEQRFLLWLAAYLVFVYGFGELLGWYHPWPYSPELVRIMGYVLLSTLTISFAFSFRTLSDRLLKGCDISYGLYIYHGLVLNCFISFISFGWMNRSNWLPVALLGVSCTIAYVSWVLVEKPALSLKRSQLKTSSASVCAARQA